MRRLAIVGIALLAAVAPLPADAVERYYSTTLYPVIQRSLTSVSNATPLALFDVLLAVALALAFILLLRRGRVLNLLTLIAVVWLLFLVAWGLNYRRVPLTGKLRYDERRVTPPNVALVAGQAVRAMNALHGAAHARPWPLIDQAAVSLVPALERAAAGIGFAPPLASRPKYTMLAPYFRWAGIDGMTDPFLLETLLASGLTTVEEPAALAHEWGHLSGYADESEAGFIGWLICQHGGVQAQYSGWVALYPHLLSALPPAEREAVHARLAPGPREDLRRIAARLAATRKLIRRAATVTYDRFLRANRVEEGIRSYSSVVRLVVGTGFAERFNPAAK